MGRYRHYRKHHNDLAALECDAETSLPWQVRKVDMVLDWSQCPAVESVPGKVSGAWVFRGTRMPVATVFENLMAGATIEEIMEWFDVSKEQIAPVLSFVARSLEAPL